MTNNICLSGGASGADYLWGMAAGAAGHTVIHFSFARHSTEAPKEEVVVLTTKELEAADEACKTASVTLKKWYPPKSLFVQNLLRRNWYQVKDSERVYAVTTIKDGLVQGGTSWATQMFMDRFNDQACECYVFNQLVNAWFIYDGKQKWIEIDSPPMPHGIWAGIGARDLTDAGKIAIANLLL